MKSYKTEGIIIKRRNFGETDRMLTIYTKEYGKIEALAKGARKSLSKLGGHIELFYRSDFVIHEGRNIDLVIGAQLANSFSHLQTSSELTNSAYYLSELLYRSTGENIENRQIYYLLNQVLVKLNKQSYQKLLCYFELKLFSNLGHEPQIDVCAHCHKKIQEKAVFDYREGGSLCMDCAKMSVDPLYLSPNATKLVRIIRKQPLDFLNRVIISDELISTLSQCTRQMRQCILERPLNCEKYMQL